MSQTSPRIRYFCVGPSNDHELAIAREVDRLDLSDKLDEASAPAILALLDFKMSSTDYEFLRYYLRWRMENPIVK